MLKTNFKVGDYQSWGRTKPGDVYTIRAEKLPREMLKAVNEQGKLVYGERRRVMKETIYKRKAVKNAEKRWKRYGNQPKQGNLFRSERFKQARGVVPTATLENTAPYAKFRILMRGISKLYGHLLDSFWGSVAWKNTVTQRKQIIARRLQKVWKKGGRV